MLPRARPQSLCQTCRSDIQSLFERGFCTPLPTTKRVVYGGANLFVRPRNGRRLFSNGGRALASNSQAGVGDDGGIGKGDRGGLKKAHELQDEDEMLASQVAAIEALEKELGGPVEEMMQRDLDLAKRGDMEADREEEVEMETYADGIEGGIEGYIETLRRDGKSMEDIVREVRLSLGDKLPDGILGSEEVRLYKRLYGEPSRLVGEEEEGIEEEMDEDGEVPVQLLDAEGEPVDYDLQAEEMVGYGDEVHESTKGVPLPVGDIGINALTKDASAQDIAKSLGGEVVEEEEYDEEEEDEEDEYDGAVLRAHPLTRLGQFTTSPRTVFPNEEGFVRPVEKVMSNFSNKQLKEMCERTFGGEGLPDSPLTPRSGRAKQQVAIPLEAGQNIMGEMEANAFLTAVMPPTYASIMSVLVETRKRLGPTWLNSLLAKEGGPRVLDASGGGVGIIAWREVVQAHWNTIHSSDRHPPPPPASKAVVLTGSDALRHRAADMLENTTFVPRLPDYVNTRSIPTLEDDRPAQQRKQFDVIIAPHGLFGLKEEWQRKQHVQNLWSLLSSNGGVLILIEKGIPRGFEALAGARELLLERHLAIPEGHSTRYSNMAEDPLHKRQTGMIVAPCTNHERCPMYTTQGLSRGRKDICSVQQRYIRPPFLQRILGAKDRNHDDVDFSYLSIMKGDDLRLRHISTWEHVADPLSAPFHQKQAVHAKHNQQLVKETQFGFESITPDTDLGQSTSSLPTATTLPRSVFPPLKRRGHVTLDLCTPAGKIERWTIPRSFSKQAYRDARKSKWGDLWALGAKTRIPRNLRLGTSEKDIASKARRGEEIGKGRGRKERMKIKAREMLERREEERLDQLQEQHDIMRELDDEADSVLLDENLQRPARKPAAKPKKSKSVPESLDQYYTSTPLPTSSSSSSSPSSQPANINVDTPASRLHSLSPSRTPTHSPSSSTTLSNDQIDQILTDWQSDFNNTHTKSPNSSKKSQKGSPFPKFGKQTKEARRVQRDVNRERVLRERAEMGMGDE